MKLSLDKYVQLRFKYGLNKPIKEGTPEQIIAFIHIIEQEWLNDLEPLEFPRKKKGHN